MVRLVTVHRRLPDLPDLFDPSGIDILRREQRQPLVRSVVIGREELTAPLPGMVNIPEPTRIARPVFGRFELTLAEGIVVASPGPGEALFHAQAGHQLSEAVSDHR